MNRSFEMKKNMLLDALIAHEGIQHIMDVAENVFGNPLFIGDISMNVFYHSKGDASDPFWRLVCTLGYADESIMKDCARNGGFDELYSTDSTQIKYFPFSTSPFLSARIRSGVNVMGHVSVYGINRGFTAEDEQLIIVFCKVMAYEMLYRGLSSGGKISYFSLLVSLLSGQKMSNEEFAMRVANSKCQFPKQMRVVVFECVREENQSLFFLREHFAAELEESLVIIYSGRLVAVCNASARAWEYNEGVLRHALADGEYRCGISRVVDEPFELGGRYRQALETLQCTPNIQPRELYYYDDSFYYHLFSKIPDRETLLNMVDPRIKALREYDRHNRTELYDTLISYLSLDRNVKCTAQAMKVHINSIYYRRKCIEELIGVDLDCERDCLAIMISDKILKYVSSSQ